VGARVNPVFLGGGAVFLGADGGVPVILESASFFFHRSQASESQLIKTLFGSHSSHQRWAIASKMLTASSILFTAQYSSV